MYRPMLQPREYHVLDKDLEALIQAEGAGRAASRPLRRAGLAVAAGLAVLAAAAAGGWLPVQATVVAGFAVAIYLGLNIGANDVANSAGAAVGAGALRVGVALAAVAAAQLAGALLAGHAVTATIARDILALGPAATPPEAARIMAAALIGAACWITLANWARAPVSTTHSIIGAVAGAGVAGLGWTQIDWQVVSRITLGWVAAPMISALMAAVVLGLLRWRVHFAADRHAAARRWLPALIGMTVAVFAAYVAGLPGLRPPLLLLTLGCITIGLAAFMAARHHLDRQIARRQDEAATLKNLLTGPLLLTALLSGFAHGANDVANVAGPLSVLLEHSGSDMAAWRIIAIGGLSIAAGSLVFGRRLVRMVGTTITRLNPVRAFCASLAAASTVLACSALGLPVSTTHCAVGGIFGVGFYREWEDRRRRKSHKTMPAEEMHRRRLVRRSHVWTTLAAWAVTVPGAALMAALAHGIISITS
ncbi:MAG: anion permease [Paracoccus sp. (in: a-proteobacteria)]|nr:anion permease [Paracoccus sp. (in: a-proteobacteria)]